MAKTILLSPSNQNAVLIRPLGWLGGQFDTYRDSCSLAGARYSKVAGGNLIPYEGVTRVADALREAGFAVEVDQALTSKLKAEADKVRVVAEKAGGLAMKAVERAKGHGLSLYDFQVEGTAWLASRDRAILADEMGLGKTIQALSALPENAAVIVVAPAVALGNWKAEIEKWRPDIRPRILRGRGSFQWPAPGEATISNYEILPEAVVEAPGPVVVIADEAHALKNPKAKRTQRFRDMAKAARQAGGKTWLLTGTPILNRPPELWALLVASDLAGESFGGSWWEFCRCFNGTKSRFGWEWQPNPEPSPDVVARLQRVMLKRRRHDVMPQLPRKTWRTVDVEISDRDRREISEIEAHLKAKGIDLTKIQDEAEMTKAEGAAFEEMSRLRRVLATSKIPSLLGIVEEYEEQDEPLVVFSAHVDPVEVLGKRPGWALIRGGISPEERTRIIEQFQAGKLKGVALTIKAGGVAITLTRASHVVFADLEWTPALNAQAEDRVARIGQTRGVIVTRLTADHDIDRRVIELLAEKQALIEGTVEAAAVVNVKVSTLASDLEALADAAKLAPTGSTPVGEDKGRDEDTRPAFAQRRPARDAHERWAAEGMVMLANLDPDKARFRNGEGFSAWDGAIGHSLAEKIAGGFQLTDRQWAVVTKLANKYRRQLPPPEEEVA